MLKTELEERVKKLEEIIKSKNKIIESFKDRSSVIEKATRTITIQDNCLKEIEAFCKIEYEINFKPPVYTYNKDGSTYQEEQENHSSIIVYREIMTLIEKLK